LLDALQGPSGWSNTTAALHRDHVTPQFNPAAPLRRRVKNMKRIGLSDRLYEAGHWLPYGVPDLTMYEMMFGSRFVTKYHLRGSSRLVG
jgi:hypothetical protein